MADLQPVGAQPSFVPDVDQPPERRLLAGEHHGGRTVDRGQCHPVLQAGEAGPGLGLGDLHRRHGAARRQRLHQTAPRLHQSAGVLEGHHAGRVGRGHLAHGVTHHRVDIDAEAAYQPVEGHLDREEGHLCVARPVEEPVPRLPEDDVLQGQPGVLCHGVERLREDGVRLVQFPPHAGTLAALAGEEQRGAARPGDAVDLVGAGAAPQEYRPVPEGRAPGQGEAHVHRVGLRLLGIRPHPGDLVPQRSGVVPGERPGHRGRHGVARAVAGGAGGRLLPGSGGRGLQDHVGVRAADPERGHGRPARPARLGPGAAARQQFHRSRRPVDVRCRLVRVQGPGQDAVPHGLDHLDDAADAGRGLGVAHVRLHGPQVEGVSGVAFPAVRGEQRLGLDRVAEPRAGAVSLDDVDVPRREARVVQGLADHPLLGRAVGGRESVGGPVLVDRRSAQDREHRVAVAPGVRQAFDEQRSHALGPAGAVGPGTERTAPSVGREAPLPAEGQEGTRCRHDRHSTGQRETALPGAQRVGRLVQGDQGRRARRVHRHRRALESEGVRDAARGHSPGQAGDEVGLQGVRHLAGRVVVVDDAGEHTRVAAPQRGRVDAGALERLPGGLQEQPLLGVHRLRLTGRDPEELRVEQGRVVQESPLADVARAGPVGVGVVEAVEVPAPVGGEAGDGVPLLQDEPPQVLGRTHAAGIAAGHAHDGDRLAVRGRGAAQLPTGLVQLGGDLLEVADQLLLGARHVTVPSVRRR